LIIALVKSWRFCTIDRLEPKFDACERSVPSASVRPLRSVSILSSESTSDPTSEETPRLAALIDVGLPLMSFA